MKSEKNDFTSIDDYITTFPEEIQRVLEELRVTIKAAAPDAREKISYQIAAFELNGKNLVHFAGWKIIFPYTQFPRDPKHSINRWHNMQTEKAL